MKTEFQTARGANITVNLVTPTEVEVVANGSHHFMGPQLKDTEENGLSIVSGSNVIPVPESAQASVKAVFGRARENAEYSVMSEIEYSKHVDRIYGVE